MTHATEPDLGPLTWVKGEIDAALGRAREILERGCAGSEAAGLQFAQSHLHQVRGALDIVGLDGLTLFTDALEQLLGAMARGEVPADAARHALALRALAMVGNYLEELADGHTIPGALGDISNVVGTYVRRSERMHEKMLLAIRELGTTIAAGFAKLDATLA
ncbi:MAG TPA: Hpt domain-containing protein, partial [Thauera aminoaromatica]|nr:Hpt domain-containing protein [Thauera aminoaromatica]